MGHGRDGAGIVIAIRMSWFCECAHEGSGEDRTVTRENGERERRESMEKKPGRKPELATHLTVWLCLAVALRWKGE